MLKTFNPADALTANATTTNALEATPTIVVTSQSPNIQRTSNGTAGAAATDSSKVDVKSTNKDAANKKNNNGKYFLQLLL